MQVELSSRKKKEKNTPTECYTTNVLFISFNMTYNLSRCVHYVNDD